MAFHIGGISPEWGGKGVPSHSQLSCLSCVGIVGLGLMYEGRVEALVEVGSVAGALPWMKSCELANTLGPYTCSCLSFF